MRSFPSLSALGKILLTDFRLDREKHRSGTEVSDRLMESVQDLCTSMRVVYTAYDGDHLPFSPFMRSAVLAEGKVPANPESILGYRDTVAANKTKARVLGDDLSALSGCDELWVFSDSLPNERSISFLAEGVLVELLFFLQLRSREKVYFTSLSGSASGEVDLLPYPFTYDQTLRLLGKSQTRDLLAISNGPNGAVNQARRDLVYHVVDPLDFKYLQWLRPESYRANLIPLVPGLAVDIRDGWPSPDAFGRVFIAWLKLIQITKRAWVFPPMDSERSSSQTVEFTQKFLRRAYPDLLVESRQWACYPIPKAIDPVAWALTLEPPRAAS